jgi:hypothetical protein
MVTEVVRVNFQIIAEIWDARRPRNFSNSVAVNGDGYGLVCPENFGYGIELSIIVNETNACSIR